MFHNCNFNEILTIFLLNILMFRLFDLFSLFSFLYGALLRNISQPQMLIKHNFFVSLLFFNLITFKFAKSFHTMCKYFLPCRIYLGAMVLFAMLLFQFHGFLNSFQFIILCIN